MAKRRWPMGATSGNAGDATSDPLDRRLNIFQNRRLGVGDLKPQPETITLRRASTLGHNDGELAVSTGRGLQAGFQERSLQPASTKFRQRSCAKQRKYPVFRDLIPAAAATGLWPTRAKNVNVRSH